LNHSAAVAAGLAPLPPAAFSALAAAALVTAGLSSLTPPTTE